MLSKAEQSQANSTWYILLFQPTVKISALVYHTYKRCPFSTIICFHVLSISFIPHGRSCTHYSTIVILVWKHSFSVTSIIITASALTWVFCHPDFWQVPFSAYRDLTLQWANDQQRLLSYTYVCMYVCLEEIQCCGFF